MTEDEKVIEHLRSCDKNPERASMYTFDNAIECIERLREERDEARREVCYCQHDSAQFAINRGWDCFKEETQ